MVRESWFSNIWRVSRKNGVETPKAVIGVLAFEVASLMSKILHLWLSLGDEQVVKLRVEIMNSVGIKKLVSEDDDYLAGLVCAEIMENIAFVARSVARLGKKCSDPVLQRFENVFDDLINDNADLFRWEFSAKKMNRKMKKMEKFIALSTNLYQEQEILTELEQALRRVQASNDPNSGNKLEIQKKVAWQLQEVRSLREISLWNRTYDYVVLLLARSLFTIFGRIKNIFGIHQTATQGGVSLSRTMDSDILSRSYSISGLMHSTVYPSVYNITSLSSISRGRLTTKSGPLEGSATKSGPIYSSNEWDRQRQSSITPSNNHGRHPHSRTKRLAPVVPFKGCMMGGNKSPALESWAPPSGYISSNGVHSGILNGPKKAGSDPHTQNISGHPSSFSLNSKNKLLAAPPSTLGAAALSLHYANIIIVIEKLVEAPHLIGPDARDDLYIMLPANIRAALRAKLKSYAKSMASPFCDSDLAAEWSEALTSILEWLAPLAHNMIRWQSERSFQQQQLASRTSVLLVQTLFFANQTKTEAAIAELLVGLNYIWRFGRELNAKALMECASGREFDDYLDANG
ncbi:hypothetical protein Sjap_013595 [Stephania japonica]|uniref:Uncharacterized protein n=1 Tax=Stephania japonica TaxID=461633 RepID=A0AAP0J002_9MAGN